MAKNYQKTAIPGTQPSQTIPFGILGAEAQGQQNFAQALGQVGNVANKYADNFFDEMSHAEYSKGKAYRQDQMNIFFEGLAGRQDYEQMRKDYDAELERVEKAVMINTTQNKSKVALKSLMEEDKPVYEEAMRAVEFDRMQQKKITDVLKAIEDFVPTDIRSAQIAAQEAVDLGYLEPETAEDWIIQQLMQYDPEGALDLIKTSEHLPIHRRVQLERRAEYKKNDNERRATIVEQAAWSEGEAEAYNLNEKGELTPQWVTNKFNAGELSERHRDKYNLILDKQAALLTETENENRKAVLAQHQSIKYDQIVGLIEKFELSNEYSDREAAIDAMLDAVVEGILDPAVHRSLRKGLKHVEKPDEYEPLKREAYKAADSLIREMERLDFWLPSDDVLEARGREKDEDGEYKLEPQDINESFFKFLEVKDEFRAWAMNPANEKITDLELRTKLREMTHVPAEGQTVKLIKERWWQVLFGGVPSYLLTKAARKKQQAELLRKHLDANKQAGDQLKEYLLKKHGGNLEAAKSEAHSDGIIWKD